MDDTDQRVRRLGQASRPVVLGDRFKPEKLRVAHTQI
jgi:hypothetical protein